MTQLLLSYCWQQFAKQRTNNVGTNSVRPFSSPTWFMETQTSQLPEVGRRGRRPLQMAKIRCLYVGANSVRPLIWHFGKRKRRCKKTRNKARGFPRYGNPRVLIYHTAKKNYLILKKGYSKHTGRKYSAFCRLLKCWKISFSGCFSDCDLLQVKFMQIKTTANHRNF